ncbi:MAG: SGNH/GDSL hydrolase family protein [Bacteroidales bacterium]|nr:SGNH/GDSL hydrolase family protein [Bacteroidales bacterium]
MKFIKDSIIIVAITIILLCVIELGLRLVFPDKIKVSEEKEILFDANPLYIYKPKSNISGTRKLSKYNGGDTIIWYTNSKGFRGKELKKDPDKRIMVYGDSNIQAISTEEANTYSFSLEKIMLNFYNSDIEVINAGVIGYGPDQAMLRMKEDIPIYKPDLVIFHIFADNDFGDILRNEIIKLDDNGRLLYSEGNPQGIFDRERQRENSFLSKLLFYKIAVKISKLLKTANMVPNTISTFTKQCNDEYESYTKLKDASYNFEDNYDITTAIDTSSASSRLKLKLLEAILIEAHNYSKSFGVEFLVLIQPSVIDISKNYIINYEHLEKLFVDYRKRNLTSVVSKICVKNDINHINLYEPFSMNNPDSLYFRIDDNHWNENGQRFASEITLDYITNRELLK